MAIHQLRKHVFGTFLKHDLYTDKAKLSQEAAKTRPHFSLPKVIIQVQTGLEYSTG